MKTTSISYAAILLGSVALLTAPALAETNQAAGRAQIRTAQEIITDAGNALQQVKSDPKFEELMKGAKGVLIVPTVVKGAVGIGGEGGQGVVLAHRDDHWSDPAFVTLSSISVGPQVGGEAGPLVVILQTEKALNDLTQNNNFSLNANAGLTIVDYSAKGQSGVGKGDIIVWSGTKGAFVGASISGSDITANLSRDQTYYGKTLTTRQIVDGHAGRPVPSSLLGNLPA